MKLAAVLILFTGISTIGFAQNKTGKNNAAIVIAAKPMTAADSGMVKQLFFSALREKTIENTKLASELFNRVLQIDPTNDASMFELAGLEKARNNYPVVQSLLERAVTSVNPNNEWYWIALAGSYEKSNDIAKLQVTMDQLIRISPDKPAYYLEKANAYFLQKDYPEALQQLAKVEAITGFTDELQMTRQRVYLAQGKIDKAADELLKLIAADPNQLRYYLLLAELYNSNGLNDKAIAILNKAAALPQTTTGATGGMLHMALADVYRDNKNQEQSPNQSWMNYMVGVAWQQNKNCTKATKLFKKRGER
jgi:tetratricopeptide (TPR) repeat protein